MAQDSTYQSLGWLMGQPTLEALQLVVEIRDWWLKQGVAVDCPTISGTQDSSAIA